MLSRFSRIARSLTTTTAFRAPNVVRPVAVSHFSTQELVLGKGRGKTSTGLTGLAVDYDAVPKMIVKYQALLDTMAASDMPETYHYRVIVEKMCRYRIQACLDNPEDPDTVEEMCNCGQVEELVEQADEEMEVLQMILANKWWERIPEEDIVVEENPDPAADAENVTWEEEPIDLKRKE